MRAVHLGVLAPNAWGRQSPLHARQRGVLRRTAAGPAHATPVLGCGVFHLVADAVRPFVSRGGGGGGRHLLARPSAVSAVLLSSLTCFPLVSAGDSPHERTVGHRQVRRRHSLSSAPHTALPWRYCSHSRNRNACMARSSARKAISSRSAGSVRSRSGSSSIQSARAHCHFTSSSSVMP